MNTQTLANATNAGFNAYNNNESAAPALSATIMDMVSGMAVGTGAAEIFQSFTDGFNMAADAECARIIAE